MPRVARLMALGFEGLLRRGVKDYALARPEHVTQARVGMTHVPVHVAANLTPAQARAYRLADNQTESVAEWTPGLWSWLASRTWTLTSGSWASRQGPRTVDEYRRHARP